MSTKPKKVQLTRADGSVEVFRSVSEAGRALGISSVQLSRIISGLTKKSRSKLLDGMNVSFVEATAEPATAE